MTLDYLVHDLLANNSIEATHHFIRDRTRSIRQDFTLQHDSGPLAIECHERIARLHILCLHEMRGIKDYTEHLELEQLRKGASTRSLSPKRRKRYLSHIKSFNHS